jgi:hypothetical protein
MTTIIPFVMSHIRAPTFTVNLDGQDYTVVVTWNVSGQRYFVNLYDLSGNWIITCPLISSPPGENIVSFTWNDQTRIVTVVKQVGAYPLRRRPGTIMQYWFRDFQPLSINGFYPECLVIDDVTFTYPATTEPGPIIMLGSLHRRLTIFPGLFQQSTMIYRNGVFEIDP